MIETETKVIIKWYHKPVMVFVAILALGPLALPLIWISPALKKWHKIVLTVLTIALTAWLTKSIIDIYRDLAKQMRDMQGLF